VIVESWVRHAPIPKVTTQGGASSPAARADDEAVERARDRITKLRAGGPHCSAEPDAHAHHKGGHAESEGSTDRSSDDRIPRPYGQYDGRRCPHAHYQRREVCCGDLTHYCMYYCIMPVRRSAKLMQLTILKRATSRHNQPAGCEGPMTVGRPRPLVLYRL
jgi:hypothetical protein